MSTRLWSLLLLAGGSAGCMSAIPQPGQTPAQVKVCTQDGNAHNWMLGIAGGLSGAGAVEGVITTQVPDKDKAGMAIASAVTAGVAAGLVGGAAYFQQAYKNDGCSPALIGRPGMARIVVAPVEGADGRVYRFDEAGWRPER